MNMVYVDIREGVSGFCYFHTPANGVQFCSDRQLHCWQLLLVLIRLGSNLTRARLVWFCPLRFLPLLKGMVLTLKQMYQVLSQASAIRPGQTSKGPQPRTTSSVSVRLQGYSGSGVWPCVWGALPSTAYSQGTPKLTSGPAFCTCPFSPESRPASSSCSLIFCLLQPGRPCPAWTHFPA